MHLSKRHVSLDRLPSSRYNICNGDYAACYDYYRTDRKR